jgi:hypothetical protein
MRRSVVFGLVSLFLLASCATGSDDLQDFPTSGATNSGSPKVLNGPDSGSPTETLDSGSGSPGLGSDTGSSTPPKTPSDDGGGSTEDASSEDASSEDASTEDAGFGDSGSATEDDSGGGSTTECMGYAPPAATSVCTACSSSSSSCQPNGCYGGYWCKVSTKGCHASPPSGC